MKRVNYRNDFVATTAPLIIVLSVSITATSRERRRSVVLDRRFSDKDVIRDGQMNPRTADAFRQGSLTNAGVRLVLSAFIVTTLPKLYEHTNLSVVMKRTFNTISNKAK